MLFSWKGGDLLDDFKEVVTVCYNYSDILIKSRS
jgi:hypothetical protein